MSGRRKRRSEDRRHREHRSLKQHHRHVKGTSDGLCLASMIAAAECPHPFHANEDECMERMLDLALDRGQIVLDHVWRLVLVPDVVAIGGASACPERAAEPETAWQARRFDGRVVDIWGLPDELAA